MGQDREGDNGTGLHRIDWKPERPAHWSAPADSSGGTAAQGVPGSVTQLTVERWAQDGPFKVPLPPDPTLATVAGCGDCPMAYSDPDGYTLCQHPAVFDDVRDIGDYVVHYGGYAGPKVGASPDFCPLRAAPLLVRLRVGP